MKRFNKLVRDKIPEILANASIKSFKLSRVDIDSSEFKLRLLQKMNEEIIELFQSETVEEAADVLEVFTAVIETYGFSIDDVMTAADEKRSEKGGFRKGVILDWIEYD